MQILIEGQFVNMGMKMKIGRSVANGRKRQTRRRGK
jgi:hypothetical protein